MGDKLHPIKHSALNDHLMILTIQKKLVYCESSNFYSLHTIQLINFSIIIFYSTV